MVDFFHLHYTKLDQVAKTFEQQAQCTEDMIKSLQTAKSRLDQSWSGIAADKFNEEMQQVFTRLNKLQNALAQTSQLVRKLADQNRSYEQTAKGQLSPAEMYQYFLNN